MDCSACAREDCFENENLLTGPGPVAAAHKGQSMPVDTLMSAPSSAAMTSFIPPAAEQTICMSAGWTMGEAVATPMKNANQTSTRRAAALELFNAFMTRIISDEKCRLPALQQLRGHRHRNHLGLLAFDAGNADRAGHVREFVGAVAAGFEPVPEGGPFGLAANQADKG
jgi:hypothetical protein